jgi:hypothetical protein
MVITHSVTLFHVDAGDYRRYRIQRSAFVKVLNSKRSELSVQLIYSLSNYSNSTTVSTSPTASHSEIKKRTGKSWILMESLMLKD